MSQNEKKLTEEEIQTAMQELIKQADQNDYEACSIVGNAYIVGKGVEKNLETAFYYLKKAYDGGEKESKANLAWLYISGQGVKADIKKGVQILFDEGVSEDMTLDKMQSTLIQSISEVRFYFLEMLLQAGIQSSKFSLATMYFNGDGTRKNRKKAVKMLTECADDGDSRAMSYLGGIYADGDGVKKDTKKAFELHKKAAELGEVDSFVALGDMYAEGIGVEPNREEAIKWYLKAKDEGSWEAEFRLSMLRLPFEMILDFAEQGDVDKMLEVSQTYLTGTDEVEQDFAKAFHWMAKAADADHSGAQFNLALMYAKGCGTDRDFSKAAEWMRTAAENGDIDAENILEKYTLIEGNIASAERGDANAQAQVAAFYMELANSIWQMESEEQDYAIALEWAKKSAAQNCAEGYWILALAYEHGRGVPDDAETALEFFTKAAELGHIESMQNIGAMYINGEGMEKDAEKAFEWFKKAAEGGYIIACGAVGHMYETGEGVEANRDEAIKWYTIAAEADNADAQFALAMLYTGDADTPVEIEKVVYWLNQALENGKYEAYQQSLLWNYVQDKMDSGEMDKNEADPLLWVMNAAQNGDEEAQEIMMMNNNYEAPFEDGFDNEDF